MRVLLVEDEYRLAEMIRICLEKEKYIVDIAYNGEEGLYKAGTEIYDIIILDVMLPKMNGMEVLKKIREKNHSMAVLMLTAKSELEDKLQGFNSGADDYMTKPFEMKELVVRIRALVRRSRKEEPDGISFQDLRLEPSQYRLCCTSTKQEIALVSKEYMIMEYLMLNSDRIMTKEQISNKIWGYENNVEYNNVEVYISFLRKKISYLSSRVRIKTIRGVGYCLEADGGA